MSTSLQQVTSEEYKYGFVTDIESDSVAAGLNEDVIKFISAKKGEPDWLLEFRLKAYRHWLTLTEPSWANVTYQRPDFQKIVYYSAPKAKSPKYASMDQVDPELLRTFEVPVVFITAYPERFLTGERPEPAFLISKPFQPAMVSAVASQALFFQRNSRNRAPRVA